LTRQFLLRAYRRRDALGLPFLAQLQKINHITIIRLHIQSVQCPQPPSPPVLPLFSSLPPPLPLLRTWFRPSSLSRGRRAGQYGKTPYRTARSTTRAPHRHARQVQTPRGEGGRDKKETEREEGWESQNLWGRAGTGGRGGDQSSL
jgi:hypothetical protein